MQRTENIPLSSGCLFLPNTVFLIEMYVHAHTPQCICTHIHRHTDTPVQAEGLTGSFLPALDSRIPGDYRVAPTEASGTVLCVKHGGAVPGSQVWVPAPSLSVQVPLAHSPFHGLQAAHGTRISQAPAFRAVCIRYFSSSVGGGLHTWTWTVHFIPWVLCGLVGRDAEPWG